MLLRQREGARSQAREGAEAVRQEVGDLARRVKDELGGLQQRVATELMGVSGEVSRQLQAGMKLIQSAQATMGDRLDSAAKVVGEVQRSEERRVGKGCRYRWCYDQSRKIAWLPSA